MSKEFTVACFSELEVVKASLLDQVQTKKKVGASGKRWEKVWGVLWKGVDGWCVSVWGRKQQWKVGAAPLASVPLTSIEKFAITSVADRDHVLRLQLVDQKEWVLACASSSVLNKWSNTLQEQLALQLLPVPTQPQTTLHRGANTRQSVTSGWVSDSDEESPRLGEELQLMLVSCPKFSALQGEYAVLVKGEMLQVQRVGGAQHWQWAWSDVLWYSLDKGNAGLNREWQLEMKIRGSCTPGGCVFTWSGASIKRFYSLLCECAPSARVIGKDRGLSLAEDTLTEGQLRAWMEELFLVELLGEAGEGVRGRFWLSVREKGVSLLDHASKEMKWEWSLADVQEFTLEACMGHKRLTIKVENGSQQSVYCLVGENIAMAFVVLKELMQAIPHQEVAQTSQVFMEEGVHLLVSHTTQLAMEAVYHLTLTAAPKECGHLLGEYKVTVDRTSLHLAGKGAGQTWCWRLEDIRRFSVQEKDTQMVFVIGRRACFGEGQFVFCGHKLRLLGLVLKELTSLLCVTTRVRRVLVQIRERIVIKLQTAAPHELIESFPVEVCASGGASPPVGQCTLQIFGSELQFVTTSGEVACCCAVKNLNQVAIGAEGETGLPQVILYSTSLGSWSIQCNDAAQLYAVLQIVKEYHMQAKTACPAMQPHTAPSTGQGTGQGANGCPIVHHVKNAQEESVFQEDCQMVLEEASLKLLRVSDGVPVWEVKLCHLQGVTMEGYTDGKGVLLVQTRQGSPHKGMQYLLLCQHPETAFEELLRYAEEHRGKGMVQEQEVECGRDSPMPEESLPVLAIDDEDEDALQTDSETVLCCSTAWDDCVASVAGSVGDTPWSMASSESVGDSLSAQKTEYSLTLSTSAVPLATLSLMRSEPATYLAPGHSAVPPVAATSSATSVLSEVSDEVFYSDPEHSPAPSSSLNLALFRPPRSITLSPSHSIHDNMFAAFGTLGEGWGGPQVTGLLYGLSGMPGEQASGVAQLKETPNSYERLWEVQEAKVEFSEDLHLCATAPKRTKRVCVITPSPQQEQSELSDNLPPEGNSAEVEEVEVYRLRFCEVVEESPGSYITQTWSVDCDNSIGVDLETGPPTISAAGPIEGPQGPMRCVPYASSAVQAPLELSKGAHQSLIQYMTEMLWVWFGEEQAVPEKEEEEEELCFHLRWEDIPHTGEVVTCQATIVVA